jgi:glycosyltransferase involved in cell wall biosynthesis
VQKEKIAIFVPSLRGGGAERIMVMLANGIIERGYKVDLVLVKAEGPYLKDVSSDVRIIDLGASRVMTSMFKLVRYLRKERPHSLLSALTHANILAVWVRMLARVQTRVIVSQHAHHSRSVQNARNVRSRIISLIMKPSYKRADGTIAVSQGVADDLAKIIQCSKNDISVVYNPVDVTNIRQKAEEPLTHPWFSSNQPPVILAVGRLVKQKDFDTLIRAFGLVRKERPARLMVLGEGREREKLLALIKNLGLEQDVTLHGFVENPFKYIKHAAVFVLSSLWEGFGNVIVEAMALGTPVVATECPSGPSEILEEGKWGRLVPPGDVDALAQSIIDTLDDSNPPAVASRAEEFSVEKAIDGYLRVLLGD